MWSQGVEVFNPYEALEGENKKKPQTNADRIRAMSDEELISFFVLEDKCPKNISSRECDGFESCKDCWVHWLKQPAEVDNGQA